MSLHVIFIDKDGSQLSDVTSGFSSVTIPQNAFIMRICDDNKSYSNSTLTKLFEIDNTFYSKVLEYTTKGDYPFIDISVSEFAGFTAIFNQLSAQFVGNNPPADIYDFTGYGGGSSGVDIDFSTIVTALNSIASALSALTNLSNLSNLSQLANIITAISNKDNQSDIVNKLDFIFVNTRPNGYKQSTFRASVFPASTGSNNVSSEALYTIYNMVRRLLLVFTVSNPLSTQELEPSDKTLYQIYNTLQNIETKLEQNLPFVTNVYPLSEVNIDVPYEVKIMNKDSCSDNRKNDIV